MASLTSEQLTMMLKTINDAAQANSVAIASLTQSQQAVTQSQQAAERAWQVAHEELHSRVHQLQTEMRSVPTSGTSTHHRSLIDPKTLMPDAFSGEPKSQSWRDWSYRLKSFIGSMQPKLQNAMERAEHKVTPVSDTEFAQLAIERPEGPAHSEDERLRSHDHPATRHVERPRNVPLLGAALRARHGSSQS